jgi:hypothetical protein
MLSVVDLEEEGENRQKNRTGLNTKAENLSLLSKSDHFTGIRFLSASGKRLQPQSR